MAYRAAARLLGVIVALLVAAPARAQGHVALGISVRDPAQPRQLARTVQLTGGRPPLVMWYQSWSEPLFWPAQIAAVQRLGTTPVVTWDPRTPAGQIPYRDVANGLHDAYLRDAAQAARGYGRPLYVRLGHEMNLILTLYRSDDPTATPGTFIAAWRHVVSVFRQAGATNVRWVWSPNVDCDGRCPFAAFYPGDAWVDWVALDGYNAGTVVPGTRWTPLGAVFGPSYDALERLTRKPMMIGETSSSETGGSKASWILHGLLREVPERLPRVKAVIWFDRAKEQQWQIDSSPESLRAFRTVAHSSLYDARSAVGAQRAKRMLGPGGNASRRGHGRDLAVLAGVAGILVAGLVAVVSVWRSFVRRRRAWSRAATPRAYESLETRERPGLP